MIETAFIHFKLYGLIKVFQLSFLLVSLILIFKMNKNKLIIFEIIKRYKIFIFIALIYILLLTANYLPGLLSSDAVVSYRGLASGTITDHYGIFWSVLLVGFASIFMSPIAVSIIQYLVYLGACLLLFSKFNHPLSLKHKFVIFLFLSPALFASAYYQHRDTMFGLLFFLFVVMSQTLIRPASIILNTFCLLLRPDYIIAYLSGVLYNFSCLRHIRPHERLYSLAILLIPILFMVSFRSIIPYLVTIDEVGTKALAANIIQPLCSVTAQKRSFSILPDYIQKDIDKAYPLSALQNRCAIGNIWIQWTSDNHFSDISKEEQDDFFKSSFQAFLNNPSAVIARGIEIHLNANGIGPEMEGLMDHLSNIKLLEVNSHERRMFNISNRIESLYEYTKIYIDELWAVGFSLCRFIFFNSLIPLIMLIFIHKWKDNQVTDTIIIMIITRSLTLICAPSAQYIYHFPVHLAALALIAQYSINQKQYKDI